MSTRSVVPRERIVVVAASAHNGLGSTAHETWAYRRAEITGFQHTPFRTLEGEPVTMSLVRQIDPRCTGDDRLRALLDLGLADVAPALEALRSARIAVSLALPPRIASEHHTRATLEAQLAARCDRVVATVSDAEGHVAFARALHDALTALRDRTIDAALVGGVDSYHDARAVETLLGEKRILGTGSLDAILPGEGAAFVLLTTHASARAAKLSALARIDAVAVSTDGQVALTRAAQSACAALEGRTLDWWLSDLTAEHTRVNELSLAYGRIAQGTLRDDACLDCVATHMGDLGAATMPTSLAIATEGLRREERATCLVTASGPTALRGALLASRAA